MDKNPAPDRNGFSRSLPRPIVLGPFQVLGANRIVRDHSDDSPPRVAVDGFVPVVFAAIVIALTIIVAID
jgi:hypothetical protein